MGEGQGEGNWQRSSETPPRHSLDVRCSMFNVQCLAVLFALLCLNLSAYATYVTGTYTIDTNWPVAGSPYIITNSLTVASNVTLTIDPGVTVDFTNGSVLQVRGRVLAEGDSLNRIRFTHAGATKTGRINITTNGMAQVRFSYVDFDGLTGGSQCINVDTAAIFVDHAWFTNSSVQYITLHGASFIVQDSVLPDIPAQVELITGHVMPANGYGIIQRDIFGSPSGGVQDVIDFTGGQRPGPIFQAYSNIFTGAVDDGLDLDGTDADIEGNIFVNCIDRNGNTGDTGSAISGGNDNSTGPTFTSHLMVARNLFYNCSHGLLCKEGNFYVVMDNTFVGMKESVLNFGEPLRGVTGGAGAIFSGNIVSNTPLLFENFTNSVMKLLVDHSLLPTNWPGAGNIVGDPVFLNPNPPTNSWPTFTNDFRLQAGSPGIGTGPNGLDIGACVAPGASISGEPSSPTTNTAATLKISGPAITGYQWRTNTGPWSSFISLTNTYNYDTNLFGNAIPIALTNLAPGTYTVYVVGVNSAGVWQDTNAATVSKTWTITVGSPPGNIIVTLRPVPGPGNGFQIGATNGPPGNPVMVLQSTNIALPLAQWTTNVIGAFDGSGNFSTNLTISPTDARRFYILKQ
jgi:hypothetical protein